MAAALARNAADAGTSHVSVLCIEHICDVLIKHGLAIDKCLFERSSSSSIMSSQDCSRRSVHVNRSQSFALTAKLTLSSSSSDSESAATTSSSSTSTSSTSAATVLPMFILLSSAAVTRATWSAAVKQEFKAAAEVSSCCATCVLQMF
jgi:hypothetical protein